MQWWLTSRFMILLFSMRQTLYVTVNKYIICCFVHLQTLKLADY